MRNSMPIWEQPLMSQPLESITRHLSPFLSIPHTAVAPSIITRCGNLKHGPQLFSNFLYQRSRGRGQSLPLTDVTPLTGHMSAELSILDEQGAVRFQKGDLQRSEQWGLRSNKLLLLWSWVFCVRRCDAVRVTGLRTGACSRLPGAALSCPSSSFFLLHKKCGSFQFLQLQPQLGLAEGDCFQGVRQGSQLFGPWKLQ